MNPEPSGKWPFVSLVFVLCGLGMIGGVIIEAWDVLGPLRWVLGLAGFSFLPAIAWYYRTRSPIVEAIETRKSRLNLSEKALRQRSRLLEKRQRELVKMRVRADQLMEYDHEETPPDGDDLDMADLDRQVFDLLESRTEQLFEKIRQNRYQTVEGDFDKQQLVTDIVDLVESVAKIYQPDARRPLLETSVEKLLKSVNRISLQMILLLEGIPFNLKDYNLGRAYDHVKTGVKAYGVYKSAEPYFNYMRPIYYLGRYTLGATPATIGAGWAFSEIFRKGTQKISEHLTAKYALNLLRDTVFIIGNGSAEIFGGDYRLRDPHWIYAAELTHFMVGLPLSGALLKAAMAELSTLPLRSEYDRLYLYRKLGAGKSPGPERYYGEEPMAAEQRVAIAQRLERFCSKHCSDLKIPREWKEGIEGRLDLKLEIGCGDLPVPSTVPIRIAQGMTSLAGFLIEYKRTPPEELADHLAGTRIGSGVAEYDRMEMMEALMDSPPMIFGYPDLELEDPLLEDYFEDLTDLGVRLGPWGHLVDRAVADAAFHFRRKKKIRERMDKRYTDRMERDMVLDSPHKRLSPSMARGILGALNPEETPRFCYKDVVPHAQGNELIFPSHLQVWLAGTDSRLLLVGIRRKDTESHPGKGLFLWEGRFDEIRVEPENRRLGNDCRITRGKWHWGPADGHSPAPGLLIPGRPLARFESYFGPLLKAVEAAKRPRLSADLLKKSEITPREDRKDLPERLPENRQGPLNRQEIPAKSPSRPKDSEEDPQPS